MPEQKPKKKPILQWQLPMKRVLWALAPVALASVYFFGWRALVVLAVANLAAFATEYAFVRAYDEPVTSAVFVTGTLFALALPPTLPLWMAVVGVVFGVAFGKMVFGGFGRNFFNPALVGRAFIYVTFPTYMNATWVETAVGEAKGFAVYTSETADAVTRATPLVEMKEGAGPGPLDLFLGDVAGSYGETCALLVLLGGFYIVWKRAANYRIVVAGLAGFLVLQTVLWGAGLAGAADPLRSVFAGGFMLGLWFFATEPISAPRTKPALWVYGAFIGALASLIRTFSAWPEGTMFAVLLGNMFAPITDYAVRALTGKKA
jgi:Na+-transporting NADH:ubiquinone oxidoreductase subunit B